jgi:hypothetical protein
MTLATIPRPQADEHVPYYGRYIALVPEGDLISILQDQMETTSRALRAIPAAKADFAYADGKWTVKEVIGHMGDVERIMSYRALRFSRGDATALPGFDENTYVPAANFGRRTIDDLVDDLETVRAATIRLLRPLDEDALARRGSANGAEISVRALAYIIAGHERHHVNVLRERYGV